MVYTCVHNHADGIDVGVYESEAAAYKSFANLIRKFFWDDMVREARDHDILNSDTDAPFPEDPFDDDVAVVLAYNEVYTQIEGERYASVNVEPQTIKTMEDVVNA